MASGAHRLSLPRPLAPLPPPWQIRQRTFNCQTDNSATTVQGSLPQGVWQVAGGKLPHCVFLFRFPLQLLPHRLHVCCTGGMLHVLQRGMWEGGHSPQTQLVALGCNKQARERGAGGGDSLDACNLSKVLAAPPLSLCPMWQVCVWQVWHCF